MPFYVSCRNSFFQSALKFKDEQCHFDTIILNETLSFLNDNVASLRDEIAFLSKFNVPYYNEEYHALLNVADDIAEACLPAPIGKVVPLTYNGDATSSEKHGRQILLEILEEMYT